MQGCDGGSQAVCQPETNITLGGEGNIMPPLTIWEERWKALEDYYIDPLINHLKPQTHGVFPLVADTVQAFHNFAKAHFTFFSEGFSESGQGPNSPRLAHSAKFPPNHILSQVLARISEDLHLLQKIALQRVVGVLPADALANLTKMDALAQRSLQLAIASDWVRIHTRALTYYETSVNIRVIPYARVALIGVPLTTINTARDLLAVPHEVGHYLYANGRITIEIPNPADPDNPLEDKPYIWQWVDDVANRDKFVKHSWLKDWAEEIYADIYGCLVIGDSIAYSAQVRADLSSRGEHGKDPNIRRMRPSHLFYNNNIHPFPYVRPETYITVLKYLEDNSNPKPKKLTAQSLGDLWKQRQAQYVANDDDAKIYGEYLLKIVSDESLTELKNDYAFSLPPKDLNKAQFETLAGAVSKKMAEFVRALLDGMGTGQRSWPELKLNGYENQDADAFFRGVENTLEAFAITSSLNVPVLWESWKNNLLTANGITIPNQENEWKPSEWYRVFMADGWSTEGPQTLPDVDPDD
jgi:hypothetical protein